MIAKFIGFIVINVYFVAIFAFLIFLVTNPWWQYVFAAIMVALIAWCLRIILDKKLDPQQKWDKLFGKTY